MSRRVFFIIQGEGRGHMTQAIALKNLLEKMGMQICGAVVGSNKRREIPSFFIEKMNGITVTLLPSPNFAKWQNRGINLSGTAWQTMLNFANYRRSVRLLDTLIRTTQPDLIINFYEPLSALWKLVYRRKTPVISIAHQYLMLHRRFSHPKGHFVDKLILSTYTKFTASGSAAKLGLSFYPMSDDVARKIYTVPPLLRNEIATLHPHKGGHFLVYMVNAGYLNDVVKWHEKNPETILHIFTDRPQAEETEIYSPTLQLHKLNDVKFLKLMATCSGLITTAGFESVCEAMYLGKPVYMIPVDYHFEQFCNSRDAHKAGAGIYSTTYDIERFVKWLPSFTSRSAEFKEWADRAEVIIGAHINRVMHSHEITSTQPPTVQGAASAV